MPVLLPVLLSVLRWLARISGLLVAGACVLLWVGDLVNPHSGPPSNALEWAGIVFIATACAAMFVAWRWELPGALLSLLSLGAFAALIRGDRTFHLAILVMAIPGLLYSLDWLARRGHAGRSHVRAR